MSEMNAQVRLRGKPFVWIRPPDIMSERLHQSKTTWWGTAQQHIARYVFAGQFAPGKSILDVACGSGYGSAYLRSRGASQVVGVDVSVEAITAAQRLWRVDGLEFAQLDAHAMDFPAHSFDVVVSFETIEHLLKPERFVREAHRLLRPSGLFLCSSPNADLNPEPGMVSWPYHKHEFTPAELRTLIARFFRIRNVYGQLYSPLSERRGLLAGLRRCLFRLGGTSLLWRSGIMLAFFRQFLDMEYRGVMFGDIPLRDYESLAGDKFMPVPLAGKPNEQPAVLIVLAEKA